MAKYKAVRFYTRTLWDMFSSEDFYQLVADVYSVQLISHNLYNDCNSSQMLRSTLASKVVNEIVRKIRRRHPNAFEKLIGVLQKNNLEHHAKKLQRLVLRNSRRAHAPRNTRALRSRTSSGLSHDSLLDFCMRNKLKIVAFLAGGAACAALTVAGCEMILITAGSPYVYVLAMSAFHGGGGLTAIIAEYLQSPQKEHIN